MSLLPPSEGVHPTLEIAVNYAQSVTAENDYTLTIRRSKKNKHGDVYKVWLKCDRGGKYDPRGLTDEVRRRQTGLRRVDCPMICVIQLGAFEEWTLTLKKTVIITTLL